MLEYIALGAYLGVSLAITYMGATFIYDDHARRLTLGPWPAMMAIIAIVSLVWPVVIAIWLCFESNQLHKQANDPNWRPR